MPDPGSDDDEPTRFLFYVSHALGHVCASAGEAAISLMLESSLVQPRTIVSLLINDLADIENEIYLFLDDYHSVTDAAIHDAVSFLLRHAPSHFHLVLTTRLEPLLPLAGLLANNQLLEIDASALRFDLSEIRRFLELIGHGQSNKEIARDLGIAPETVKSHVKNIFVKLAVERRVQAVSRAQSLGLVQTH
jgi:LuxR family maltose regulon positive regulatory protein